MTKPSTLPKKLTLSSRHAGRKVGQTLKVARTGLGFQLSNEQHIRLCDLVPFLGQPDPTDPIANVETDDQNIRIEFSSGAKKNLQLSAWEQSQKQVTVIKDIGQLLTANGPSKTDVDALGLLHDAAVVLEGRTIKWVGLEKDLPSANVPRDSNTVSAQGRLVTPGLVDCHSHPVFAGERSLEFSQRATGLSYQEIAANGGGIQASTRPTRAATTEELVESSCRRLENSLASGTTTTEAKSGYDLTAEGEIRLLLCSLMIDAVSQIDVSPTLLGAHVVPSEYANDRAAYIAEVVEKMIPNASDLADAVDVYCDQGAFSLEESRLILEAAAKHGFLLRAHVGQFKDIGAAEMVAEMGGTSCDHLEQISAQGIQAMAQNDVVAVMLPGACVQLGMTPPPVSKLRDAKVSMAIATDHNPGTSMGATLPIQMWLACCHYNMTVAEAWLGVTRNAAKALGRNTIGRIAPGFQADLVFWGAEHYAEIPYRYDANLTTRVIKRGLVL